MLRGLKRGIADMARRSVLGLAGAMLMLVALVFFTIAAWKGLVIWNGPIAAALVLGAFYAVAGIVLLLMAREPAQVPETRDPPERDPAPMQRVVAAFLEGMAAGVTARRRPPDRRDDPG